MGQFKGGSEGNGGWGEQKKKKKKKADLEVYWFLSRLVLKRYTSVTDCDPRFVNIKFYLMVLELFSIKIQTI